MLPTTEVYTPVILPPDKKYLPVSLDFVLERSAFDIKRSNVVLTCLLVPDRECRGASAEGVEHLDDVVVCVELLGSHFLHHLIVCHLFHLGFVSTETEFDGAKAVVSSGLCC